MSWVDDAFEEFDIIGTMHFHGQRLDSRRIRWFFAGILAGWRGNDYECLGYEPGRARVIVESGRVRRVEFTSRTLVSERAACWAMRGYRLGRAIGA